jgi:VIT1/CCC1 family predicted Fe2+/Mn2+ transporter
MSISKRLEEARQAYARRDMAASQRAHDAQRIAQAVEEHGGTGHQYIGDFVYGGLDGIITTFAVVSGVAGASLGPGIVLILGLANLFADGFSMATGAYLSAKSEREYYDREREREAWEVAHFPDGERAELLEIYGQRGYTPEDAAALVALQTQDHTRWVDTMMVHELGLLPDEKKPLFSALATFGAFVLAGVVPMFVFLVGLARPLEMSLSFGISLGLSALALFGLGAAKVLVTAMNWFRSGLEMLLVGGLAGGVAYLVGYLLKGLGA